MATVISHGAAENVTGSCHFLEINNIKMLIDCGMFQGSHEEKNEERFGFNPAEIDYLLLTHAHIDHIGRVPKLVKEGFKGTIVSTSATWDIAYIMLMDAAKIFNEEYRTLYRKKQRVGEEDSLKKPLYDEDDIYDTFQLNHINAIYNEAFVLSDDITLTFKDAGHILGSSFIQIDFQENNLSKSVVFSGDIGNIRRLVIDGLQYGKQTQTLFVESTYGDRVHRDLDASIAEFKEVIKDTIEDDGIVLIPSFALERTQEILVLLKEMFDNKELEHCKVFLDSPLAIKATELYSNYPLFLNEKHKSSASMGENPFLFDALRLTRDIRESMTINDVKKRAIIIAGSGMCTGGRILHHFKHRLWDKNNAVIFVGFQVEGTLGREIIDGTKMINVRGENVMVNAKVHTINGFSAHGDREDLIDWISHFKDLEMIYLIHGECDKMDAFKTTLKERFESIKVHIVKEREHIYI
ncbi:MAG: MBL fold metallo-hydrolase [Campylobacterales bacterium]|nr:MBL fold metallo-hydrolase [Campylobacterales bacterium]